MQMAAVPVIAQSARDAGGAGIVLVEERRFLGKIFIPSDATDEERAAARTLATWVREVTGATAEIVPEPDEVEAGDPPGAGVYVGATRQAALQRVRAPEGAGDAWLWEERHRRALFILGNSPVATRLAVGDFVRRHLGVVFLVPGEWGAEWTPRRTLVVPRGAHVRRPSYLWRNLSVGTSAAEGEWCRNNGLGDLPLINHSLHTVFDKAAAGSHPEFFPTIGGVRKLPSGRGGYEPQPHLAAPGAASYAARRASDFFARDAASSVFSLSINDNMGWDETAETRALAPRGCFFRNRPDYSGYVFAFMNRVATALWPAPTGVEWDAARWRDAGVGVGGIPPLTAVPPEKLLTCLAYHHCENVPGFALHPNIFPVLTADRSQWRDPAFREEDRDLIRRWARSGVRHFGLYDYYYGNDHLVPRIFLRHEAESIRWGAENGASLFYAEVNANWGFDGPKSWLAAQLLLDAGQEPGALLERYFNEAYGPAAASMREFFAIAERCWDEQPGPARWIKFWLLENAATLFPPGRQRQMRAALANAERVFPPPRLPRNAREAKAQPGHDRLLRQRARVRMTSLAFASTERLLEWYRLRENLLRRTHATPGEVRDTIGLMALERAARKDFLAALGHWRTTAVNPGATPAWAHFLTGGTDATLVGRLLDVCARNVAGNSGREDWREAFVEVALLASRCGLAPMVNALHQPASVKVLARDDFGEASFRHERLQDWASGDPAGALKPPWKVTLLGTASGRLGNGGGFLRIRGQEQATLSREVAGLGEGDWVLAKAFCRGRVNPGASATLEVAFVETSTGKPRRARHVALLLPGICEDWRLVANLVRVPRGVQALSVSLRSMGQEVDETLDWRDFSVEKLPPH
jgi:hypothetical protein